MTTPAPTKRVPDPSIDLTDAIIWTAKAHGLRLHTSKVEDFGNGQLRLTYTTKKADKDAAP